MPLRAFQQFQLYSVQSDLRSGARSAAMSDDYKDDDVHEGDDKDEKIYDGVMMMLMMI